jgi:hypothetical protein
MARAKRRAISILEDIDIENEFDFLQSSVKDYFK